MTGKQIGGVILLLIGLGITFIGGTNVMDLINAGNNPLVAIGLQAMGTSMSALWLKYGGLTVVGIVFVITGIFMTKKTAVSITNN